MKLPSSIILKILDMRITILKNNFLKIHKSKLKCINYQLEYLCPYRYLDELDDIGGYILSRIDGMPLLIEKMYLDEISETKNIIE